MIDLIQSRLEKNENIHVKNIENEIAEISKNSNNIASGILMSISPGGDSFVLKNRKSQDIIFLTATKSARKSLNKKIKSQKKTSVIVKYAVCSAESGSDGISKCFFLCTHIEFID